MLALCAYCACLSPTLGTSPVSDDGNADDNGLAAGVGEATRIAAEMWYVPSLSLYYCRDFPFCSTSRNFRSLS